MACGLAGGWVSEELGSAGAFPIVLSVELWVRLLGTKCVSIVITGGGVGDQQHSSVSLPVGRAPEVEQVGVPCPLQLWNVALEWLLD